MIPRERAREREIKTKVTLIRHILEKIEVMLKNIIEESCRFRGSHVSPEIANTVQPQKSTPFHHRLGFKLLMFYFISVNYLFIGLSIREYFKFTLYSLNKLSYSFSFQIQAVFTTMARAASRI